MRTLLPSSSDPHHSIPGSNEEGHSMNICGCLVHATAEKADAVRSGVEALDGVEVHAVSEDGRLVVVVEDTETKKASEQIMAMHQIPGVISVTLTYHHFEDLAADDTASLPAQSSQVGDQTHDNL
ncbi:chaperone NapD [Roseibium sp. Sym1]|uniref:chaperone NapD n=1 Tax=Roseibium sp. Sym1 TaxID=3016006 RepID=UPI0022B59A89|nr:chaperone NapD [Roseibium sp. Sym1]